jgi:hypothetical protein
MSEQHEHNHGEVTIESLVEQALERVREQGAEFPKGQSFLHDLPLIFGIRNDIMEAGPHNGWHNAALGFLADLEAPAVLGAMIDTNPLLGLSLSVSPESQETLLAGLAMLMEVWFIIGYTAGEGPEHIHKCTESHGVTADPTMN